VVPSLAAVVRDDDEDDGEKRSLRSRTGQLSTLQQRFEESHRGKVVISVFIAVFLLVGVIWNLPDSPIQRGLKPVVAPIAVAAGLDQFWGVYWIPDTRVETVQVQVTMANGETRVWTMQPGARGVGWWDRWILLRRAVIHDASVRPQLAHWVVRNVTGPNERAVAVAVIFRTENLSPPGAPEGGKSPATKVLYQEALVGAQ
jgi:hypothetical protein